MARATALHRVRAVFALVALAATASARAAEPAASGDPTALVRAAAQQLTAQRHGITAYLERYRYHEHGPGHDKRQEIVSWRVRLDGRLAAVKLLAQSDDGRALSASDLARAQADIDKQLPSDPYRLPVSSQELADYRFSAADAGACGGASCPDGAVAIAFVSRVRDAEHGDGVAIVDARNGRVLRLDFHPSVLPARADSGEIHIAFGAVLPDLWDVTENRERYTGHVLFMHGYGEIEQTNSGYRRFATVQQAVGAAPAAPGP